VTRRQGGASSFKDGVRNISPFLVFGVAYYVLAVLLKISYNVWIPAAFAIALAEAIVVLGKLYKPFRVDKEGRCAGSRESMKTNSMDTCRHYSPGSRSGGCGHRDEIGRCHLRRK